MRDRPGWDRAARRIARSLVRRISPALAFTVVERAGPHYARLALRAGGWLLPRGVPTFPAKVASLLGEPLGPRESERLIEGRVVFLLTRALLAQVLLAHPSAEGRRRLVPIGVDGAAHLEAAIGEGRGIIVVSAHFGLPPLIPLVLGDFGSDVIGVGGKPAPGVDLSVSGDVWDRARGLQRLRGQLAENRACLFLPDGVYGRYTEAPFLGGRIGVTLGPFHLAQVTGSPLLTAFAVRSRGTPRFRVEIGRALSVPGESHAEPPTEAVAEFARRYEALARRHPCQLFGYEALFAPGAPLS